MRLAIRVTILCAAALVSLAGCSDFPAAPAPQALVRAVPAPSTNADSTQCLSGYQVSNGIVTCTDGG